MQDDFINLFCETKVLPSREPGGQGEEGRGTVELVEFRPPPLQFRGSLLSSLDLGDTKICEP